AEIRRLLVMEEVEVKGGALMDSIRVGHDFVFRHAKLARAQMTGAKVDGSLLMDDTVVTGCLGMESLDVARHLDMWEGTFGDVYLVRYPPEDISFSPAAYSARSTSTAPALAGTSLWDRAVTKRLNGARTPR